MSRSPRLGIRQALAIIDAGTVVTLDGRGVNDSYRVAVGDGIVSVKVHSADRSSDVELERILRVDAALRGAAWYPPVIDIGLDSTKPPRLVVIRPFAPGAPSDDARRNIAQVIRVLGDLAAYANGVEVPDGVLGDYASPWVSSAERERRLAGQVLTGEWVRLAHAIDHHVSDLRVSAVRLTRPENLVVCHGDLNGRNLIFNGSRSLTVIDWDEAGFSHRPADAGKALWLLCRRRRGDFVLDPAAVRHFLERLHARLRFPITSAVDLAKLGAIWFLPRQSHLALLERRDAGLPSWYLGWVSRFWSRFRENLDLLTRTATMVDRNGRCD